MDQTCKELPLLLGSKPILHRNNPASLRGVFVVYHAPKLRALVVLEQMVPAAAAWDSAAKTAMIAKGLVFR